MKNKLFTPCFLALTCFLFCNSINTKIKKPPLLSTIDSLQGKWMWVLDSNFLIVINGNESVEKSVSKLDTAYNTIETCKLYFSDTLYYGWRNQNYEDLIIDTTKKSGKYLIQFYPKDSNYYCYKISRIRYSSIDTTFSITDLFQKRKTINFIKIP
jgi:hypothetical protein